MAHEVLFAQLADSLYQVTQCYAGADEGFMEVKVTDSALTPRQTLAHLAEANLAAVKHLNGEPHEWGSDVIEDQSTQNLMKVYLERRESALAKMGEATEEAANGVGYPYILAHEYYHVGQLVLARMKHQAHWNAYSIYNFG